MLGAVYAGCCYSDHRRAPAGSRARATMVDKLAAPAGGGGCGVPSAPHAATFERLHRVVCHRGHHRRAQADSALLARPPRRIAIDLDPLYVNFTSGSTGTPKGVAVCHRSVIDFIGSFASIFGITQDDVLANQAPFDFDVSVKDVYGGLATGATVQMIPREFFSVPVNLMDFLVEREVTVCTWAVSAMCFVSMMGGFDYRVPTTIRDGHLQRRGHAAQAARRLARRAAGRDVRERLRPHRGDLQLHVPRHRARSTPRTRSSPWAGRFPTSASSCSTRRTG